MIILIIFYSVTSIMYMRKKHIVLSMIKPKRKYLFIDSQKVKAYSITQIPKDIHKG